MALLEREGSPQVSPIAVAAGGSQLHLNLTTDESARLDALRKRVTDANGRSVVRVFVLRECLLRGLRARGDGLRDRRGAGAIRT